MPPLFFDIIAAVRGIVIAVGVALLLAGGQLRGVVTRSWPETDQESRLVYVPPADVVETWSFGYRESLSDLLYIRGNIATAVLKERSEHQWIERFFNAAQRLDPKFRAIYRWAAVAGIYTNLKDLQRSDVEVSRRVHRKAVKAFPNDFEVIWYAGMTELSEVNARLGYTEDEVAEATERGTRLIRRAATLGANPVVQRLSMTLGAGGENADIETERAFLRSQLLTGTDEEQLLLARKRLLELSGDRDVSALERVRLEFEEERLKQYPYLAPPIFMLLDNAPE